MTSSLHEQQCALENCLPQISHSNGFFPSCTESECCFNLDFYEKVESQMLYLNGFFPSWTDNACFPRLTFWVKVALQM